MPFGPRNLIELDNDLSELVKVPGKPGYYINRSGEVFTVRKLAVRRDKQGYARVQSGRLRAGVHSLLAKVFLPAPRPEQNEVRHLDGNPSNNSLDNLAWGTRGENAQDMARHGTLKGEKNPKAKLTEVQVRTILEMKEDGYSRAEIMAKVEVSNSSYKAIVGGQNWSHVKERILLERARLELAEL
jgi:hypothetical protein